MQRLRGAIRQYAWGSRTALAELTGRPTPSPQPEAELWLGAHPVDPAWLVSEHGERSLLEVVREHPDAQLGDTLCSQFGGELPFLMKVIAADQPLSLQAHPNAQQARAGFEREELAHLPISAPDRNYRDLRHKPELVVALERFDALAGFRPLARTRELLRAYGIDHITALSALDTPCHADALRTLFTTWMSSPAPCVDDTISTVLDGAARYLHSGAVEFAAEATTLLELGERHPGDAGVLAALLLNRITLDPGGALFLPAGNLHAYLRGVAVEVMANSDNVLRGGLTSKHVDVAELMRVLDFTPVDEAALRPATRLEGPRLVYLPIVEEFAVSMWSLDTEHLGRDVTVLEHEHGPHILLCTHGSVALRDDRVTFTLRRGQAAWASANDRPVVATAHLPATLFCTGVAVPG